MHLPPAPSTVRQRYSINTFVSCPLTALTARTEISLVLLLCWLFTDLCTESENFGGTYTIQCKPQEHKWASVAVKSHENEWHLYSSIENEQWWGSSRSWRKQKSFPFGFLMDKQLNSHCVSLTLFIVSFFYPFSMILLLPRKFKFLKLSNILKFNIAHCTWDLNFSILSFSVLFFLILTILVLKVLSFIHYKNSTIK